MHARSHLIPGAMQKMKTPTNAERPEEPSTKAEEFHDASPGVECAQLPGSVRKFIATQEGLVVFHNIQEVLMGWRTAARGRHLQVLLGIWWTTHSSSRSVPRSMKCQVKPSWRLCKGTLMMS
eukprot:Polyplicarium_translucidae@DN3280_c0_g2_i7.p1